MAPENQLCGMLVAIEAELNASWKEVSYGPKESLVADLSGAILSIHTEGSFGVIWVRGTLLILWQVGLCVFLWSIWLCIYLALLERLPGWGPSLSFLDGVGGTLDSRVHSSTKVEIATSVGGKWTHHVENAG